MCEVTAERIERIDECLAALDPILDEAQGTTPFAGG
jgi:hypothetical protein